MQTYTSTVTAVGPTIAAGSTALVISTAILGLTGVPIWPMVATVLVIAVIVSATAVYLSTVRLTVGEDSISVALGLWGRARWIHGNDIESTCSATFHWPEVYGFGRLVNTRMTVRAGPTLLITLHGGEIISISTPNPDTAQRVLSTPNQEMT